MRLAHFGLALLVVAVWGSNFVVIKHGLRDFQPFLFATLRFFFSALPFAFFIPRPRVAWKWLVLYGVFLGAGQFGLLFYAMRADISPGLTSLVVQVQVFFTIALSVLLFRERVSTPALAGLVLAAAGLAVIAFHLDASVTAKGILTVICAAFFWGCANVVVKKAALESKARVNMLAFVVWSSLFAVPPLTLMSLAFEGAGAWSALGRADVLAWLAVAWQSLGNTLFAFAAWSWLLTRYDAAVVTPYALLVPVFGMGSSALLLGEPLPPWKLTAAAMVLAGIALGTLVPALIRRRR
ncbi:MAG TPA: EamA family transporter [Usitatibacter sp.]|nr:EamA family transporter [Usitatibacter sp.]